MASTTARVALTAFMAAIGFGVGWTVGIAPHALPQPANYPFLAEPVPLPHHVPKDPGGLAFRFAMAHDVIHERFPKRGPEHYAERNRVTREAIDALDPDDPARFPLEDDLAAGLDRIGEPDEAVAVMRGKLDRQRATGLDGIDLYTSFANLGTFLIHASFGPAVAGDPDARGRFEEGVAFIRQSVAVNPGAHFGRERWQAAIAEFLLAAMDDPALLTTFDCLGNRLDAPIEWLLHREQNWTDTGYGRPYDAEFARRAAFDGPPLPRPDEPIDDPGRWEELAPVREHVTRIGAERGWEDVPVPSHREPAPFDEPMLGIIGMWRQGGGANPHFALAMGETMLRVGQRYIAWSAFERASRMADRSWPDPELRASLVDHCRRRQREIEETLRHRDPSRRQRPPWQQVSPPPAEEVVAGLRSQFDEELALGTGYQEVQQRREAERITAGEPIAPDRPDDTIRSGLGPIASPVGPEEWFLGVPRPKVNAYVGRRQRTWGIFGAGLASLATGLLTRWRAGAGGLPRKPDPFDRDEL